MSFYYLYLCSRKKTFFLLLLVPIRFVNWEKSTFGFVADIFTRLMVWLLIILFFHILLIFHISFIFQKRRGKVYDNVVVYEKDGNGGLKGELQMIDTSVDMAKHFNLAVHK